MNNNYAIQVQNLQKTFGENKAVQGVSFEVQEGEIFSLLGPNGAGKTTTISMLCCLLRPDEGDALIMGHSILQPGDRCEIRFRSRAARDRFIRRPDGAREYGFLGKDVWLARRGVEDARRRSVGHHRVE